MLRQIIKIDEDKCVGCGLCVNACHEGAIGLVGGKAKLLSDNYCDGLGNCLPVCPTKAITFEQRDTDAYDITIAPKRVNNENSTPEKLPCGCPGTHSKMLVRSKPKSNTTSDTIFNANTPPQNSDSNLAQWPCQIKLVPVNAPYFDGANLLVSADCSAYAYGNYHDTFMKNKVTIIGCPKLDEGDYSKKLTEIIKQNNIKSVTVTRMEVPCCGGLEKAVVTALKESGKFIPWQVVTITTDGRILE